MPERIKRERTKGWRKPAGAVIVDRTSKWGNPYRWQDRPKFDYDVDGEPDRVPDSERRMQSVIAFTADVRYGIGGPHPTYPSLQEIRAELAGKDLVCWCGPDDPCHATTLLKIANCSDAEFARMVADHGRW